MIQISQINWHPSPRRITPEYRLVDSFGVMGDDFEPFIVVRYEVKGWAGLKDVHFFRVNEKVNEFHSLDVSVEEVKLPSYLEKEVMEKIVGRFGK